MAHSPTPEEHRWSAQPVAAGFLGLCMVVVPVLVGVLAAIMVADLLGSPENTGQTLFWWVVVLGASIIGAVLAERVTRRLLPLRMLLRATMTFPSRPPPKWRVAARRPSTGQLLERLEEARVDAEARLDAEAMTRLLILITALQAHDPRTRGHAERVRMLVDLMAEELELDEWDHDRVRWAALLHDLGKLDIAPEVLHKAQPLEEEEWDDLKRHPDAGMKLAAPLLDWLGPHASGIGEHHERFDGDGYPNGLAGTDIGLAARMIAVVDAFEVMTGPREYRPRMTIQQARDELVACSGTQFDPEMVRAFLELSVARLARVAGALSALGALVALRPPPGAAAGALSGALVATMAVTGIGLLPSETALSEGGPTEESSTVAEAGAEEAAQAAGGTGSGGGSPAGSSPDPAGETADTDPAASTTSAPEGSAGTDADEGPSTGGTTSGAGSTSSGGTTSGGAGTTGGGAGTTTGGGTATGAGTGGAVTGDSGTGGTDAGTADPGAGTGTGGTTAPGDGGAPDDQAGAPPSPGQGSPPADPDPPTSPPTDEPAPPPDPTTPPESPPSSDPEPATPTPTPEPPPPQPPPEPQPDRFFVPANSTATLNVLANDGGGLDPSTLSLPQQPNHGSASVSGGLVVVQTDPDYIGRDNLIYRICNSEGACRNGVVVLEIS